MQLLFEKCLNDSSYAETLSGQRTTLRDAMISVAEEVLGFQKRKNQYCFDVHQDEIDQLINQKRETRLTFETLPSIGMKKTYQ